MREAVIVDVEFDANAALQNIANLNGEMSKLRKEQAELRKEGKEGTVQYAENALAIKDMSAEARSLEKELKNQTKVVEANNGSLSSMKAQLSLLTKEYDGLSKEQRENAEVGGVMQQQILEITEELKGAEEATGNYRRSVGSYKVAIDDAIDSTEQQSGALGGVIQGLKGAKTAALAFIATPLGAVLGAIALALSAVTSWFKRSAEGQEAFNKIATVSEAILGTVLDVVGDLGESIFKAFNDPKQTVMDLGNAIKNFVIERVEKGLSGIKLIGSAVAKLFKGDFRGALEDAKDGALDLLDANPGFALMADLVEGATEKVKELNAEIRKDAKDAATLAERQNALRRREIDFLVQKAELERQISEERTKSYDRDNFTLEEQLAAQQKAIELTKQLNSLEKGIAAEKLSIRQLENSINDSTLEDLEEEAQLKADLILVEKAQSDQLRELLERVFTLRAEIEKGVLGEEKKPAEAAKKATDGIAAEYDRRMLILKQQLRDGVITQAEFDNQVHELTMERLNNQIAAMQFLRTGHLST